MIAAIGERWNLFKLVAGIPAHGLAFLVFNETRIVAYGLIRQTLWPDPSFYAIRIGKVRISRNGKAAFRCFVCLIVRAPDTIFDVPAFLKKTHELQCEHICLSICLSKYKKANFTAV